MRRVLVVAALLAGVGLLAGCGIRPTGVVAAGDPATGVAAPDLYVYYVVGDDVLPLVPPPEFEQALGAGPPAAVGTELVWADTPAMNSVHYALAVLLLALPARLRGDGVRTEVPGGTRLTAPVRLGGAAGRATADVSLTPTPRLSARALVQFGCTVTRALGTGGAVWSGTVRVSGGGRLVTAPCPPAIRDALPFAPPSGPRG